MRTTLTPTRTTLTGCRALLHTLSPRVDESLNTEVCGYDNGDCCSCDCTEDRDYLCGTLGYSCVNPDSDCFGEEGQCLCWSLTYGFRATEELDLSPSTLGADVVALTCVGRT